MMETAGFVLLVGIGLVLTLAGIVFCVLPILPGPPMSWAGLVLIDWAYGWAPFDLRFLIIMAVLMILVTALDGVIPLLGARRYGASGKGIWGSAIGLIVGMFFFPPWGIFIGAFVGALAGELMSGKDRNRAMRVGWGIFVGTMLGIGLKLAYSLSALVFFFRAMI